MSDWDVAAPSTRSVTDCAQGPPCSYPKCIGITYSLSEKLKSRVKMSISIISVKKWTELIKFTRLTFCTTKLKDFQTNILKKPHINLELKNTVFNSKVQVMKNISYKSDKVLK